jgi:UDP-glucose:(heptosyl)LPS alpha-1,3-glucosyltransferase
VRDEAGPHGRKQRPAPQRMRIAVLNRVFRTSGGGAETYSIRIVEQLAKRHEVHVFSQEFEHESPDVAHRAVPRAFKRPRWLNQLWYAAYTWWATRHGFDVVHSHENTWHGQVQTIHVWPARGDLLDDLRGWRRAVRWLRIAVNPRLATNLWLEAARFRAKPGRRIVLASTALRDRAVALYPHSEKAMSVIMPGVAAPAGGPSGEEARASLGLPQDHAVILFVANDFARKGLEALLAALMQLPHDVSLAVVGGGQAAPYLQRVQRAGLEDRVHFLGALQDMSNAYRAATLLVHPTLGDTFAMAVLEGMAHGLPVVVSGPATCGISALLRDGEEAILLDNPRDADEIAEAVTRLLDDARLAATLQRAGPAFAARYSWEDAARRYEALYAQVANRAS